jgi:RNA polymerase sigma-70 factor (ECF subfamily)
VGEGNEEAYRSLYLHYYDPLFRFAMSFLRSETDSEDVVSDVFLNLWVERDTAPSILHLRPYLYSSVRNACLNVLKSHHVSRRNDISREEAELQVTLPADSPFEHLSHKELTDIMRRAIKALPERCRMVFKLRKEDELSYQEIAHIMDTTVRTAERQMMLAKEKIRNALYHYYPEGI